MTSEYTKPELTPLEAATIRTPLEKGEAVLEWFAELSMADPAVALVVKARAEWMVAYDAHADAHLDVVMAIDAGEREVAELKATHLAIIHPLERLLAEAKAEEERAREAFLDATIDNANV